MIVLDTNVVSELMRPAPDAFVERWVRSQDPRELSTTAVTAAEVRYGLERLPRGRRRNRLTATAEELFSQFADQVLPFDALASVRYASVVAARDRAGTPISGFDAQIAAIALVHDAALATRNVRDFADTGVTLIDPFDR